MSTPRQKIRITVLQRSCVGGTWIDRDQSVECDDWVARDLERQGLAVIIDHCRKREIVATQRFIHRGRSYIPGEILETESYSADGLIASGEASDDKTKAGHLKAEYHLRELLNMDIKDVQSCSSLADFIVKALLH